MICLAFWKILWGCHAENRLLRIGQEPGDQLLGSCGNPGERSWGWTRCSSTEEGKMWLEYGSDLGSEKKSVKSDSKGFDLSHGKYLLTCGELPYASHSIWYSWCHYEGGLACVRMSKNYKGFNFRSISSSYLDYTTWHLMLPRTQI